jgi:hypothetical protein
MAKIDAGPDFTMLLGSAKEEINPPADSKFVMYPVTRPYCGVESDLHARAVAFGDLSSSSPAAALTVLDALYVHPDIVAAIRERAAAAIAGLDPEAVMVAATHTHSAPPLKAFDVSGRGWAGRIVLDYPCAKDKPGVGSMVVPDPKYVEKVKAAGARAIVRAWEARCEVRGRVGLAEAHLGHNRRVVGPDGKATNVWQDPDGKHTGYFDPRIRFVVFDDVRTSRAVAVVAGYGCHPVTLGPGNARPSPDYPGHFAGKLEATTGANLAVHVTTGGANINPRFGLCDGPEGARAMGEALAEAVIAALGHTQPVRLTPVSVATAPLELSLRRSMGKGPTELLAGRIVSPLQRTVLTEVQAIRMGELAFVSAPGELFAELVVAVENASPVAHTFVVGHANDALGYLFTDAAAMEGGYEVVHGSAAESVERPFLDAAIKALTQAAHCERRGLA